MKKYQPLLRLSTALRRGFNCYAEDPDAMAIKTGLSVVIAGCTIEVVKDSDSKRASVEVRGDVGRNLDAVKVAADLLAQRARRTLGGGWEVTNWVPKRKTGVRKPVPGPTG